VWRSPRADEKEESGALADTSSGRRVFMLELNFKAPGLAGGAASEAARHGSL
jgi:hypothetical protein